ncbi:GerMN domain-containing protein [Paenibacillus doosanensis]|uniref:Sporulation and spore germination n=1 Tax=Paenibacillus konkukensis TaxID=2020716 RepID=A0ABY4RL83_9BACL|nr:MULTISPECIES: GerMN domain-containing protein [Paenibacillus]MCS7462708.1 GerMN domain-containing protein [Paenibacillus doosanensis]UQZ82333.1 Sporulation and spore germination [Paenibacillus konkukensis]
MQQHNVRGILIASALALALSGCGQKPMAGGPAQGAETPATGSSQTTPPPLQTNNQTNSQTADQTGKAKEAIHSTIKAYYGDEQQTKVVEQQVSINYQEDKDKYTAALWTLKKAPQNSSLVPLAAALGFKSAVLKDKKLTVDLTVSSEGRLGAPGELMLLDAIKKTLFQFPEVESIDILVDGKAEESLMGHMDLPHPMTRDSQ